MLYRGQPTPVDYKLGLANWGEMQIELIVPTNLEHPAIYRDWLESGTTSMFEAMFPREHMIATATIFWATRCFSSSVRYYANAERFPCSPSAAFADLDDLVAVNREYRDYLRPIIDARREQDMGDVMSARVRAEEAGDRSRTRNWARWR